MLMQEPTNEMIKEWQDIYNKNKDNLRPNKKRWFRNYIDYEKRKRCF